MKVWEVMSQEAPKARLDTRITKARALLRKSDRRIVVVLKDPITRKMEGFIARRDALTVTSAKSDRVLREIIREAPYALPSQDIEEVVSEMRKHNLYEIPVIEDEVNKVFVGSVSTRDILRGLRLAGYRPKAVVVNEIMTTDNIERYLLPQQERITKAWPRLVKGEVPAIIVVRSEKMPRPVGILTPKDLIDSGRWYFRREGEKILTTPARIRNIMTRGVVVARPNTPIDDVVDMMIENDFTLVPVIDENGFVIGVVTQFDVIRAFLEGAKPERVRVPVAPKPIPAASEELSREAYLQQVLVKAKPLEASRITAKEATIEEIPAVKISDTVEHALRVMLRHKVDHILVVDDDGRVLGSVSKRRLLYAIGIKGPLWRRRAQDREFIKDVLNESLPIVYEDTPIEDVARRMIENDSEIALVVNTRGELVGVVTKEKLVEAFLKVAPDDLKVADLVAPGKVSIVHPHHTLTHAVKKLRAYYLDALVVVDGKEVKGVVSVNRLPFIALEDARKGHRSRKLIWVRRLEKGWRKAGRYIKITPILVEDAMVPMEETVSLDERAERAVKLMFEKGVDGVPVVDERGNPVGVLCKLDIVRELARRAPLKKIEREIKEVRVKTSE